MQSMMQRLLQRQAISLTVPFLWLALSMPASAQIEEITVTATKREENVQDIAVAVSVLSSDTIENAHAVGFESLQALIPSVSFRKGTTNRNSAVTVRGIGTISFSTSAEPSVATVVDGVDPPALVDDLRAVWRELWPGDIFPVQVTVDGEPVLRRRGQSGARN